MTISGFDYLRNCAPELLQTEAAPSSASDVYAFAMTALEILTGELPYAHIPRRRSAQLIHELLHGARPQRPQGEVYVERGLDDAMWKLLERSWAQEPEHRPTMGEVVEELEWMP